MEWCWCRGYGNSCGLIRSLRSRQYHSSISHIYYYRTWLSSYQRRALVASSSGAWQWTRIRRRIILGSNYEKIQVVYTKKHALFTTRRETSALDCSRGVVLTKKNLRIPGSLSLSLSSTGRESERRGRGELDPNRVQPPNHHFRPTHSIPGRRTDRHF